MSDLTGGAAQGMSHEWADRAELAALRELEKAVRKELPLDLKTEGIYDALRRLNALRGR